MGVSKRSWTLARTKIASDSGGEWAGGSHADYSGFSGSKKGGHPRPPDLDSIDSIGKRGCPCGQIHPNDLRRTLASAALHGSKKLACCNVPWSSPCEEPIVHSSHVRSCKSSDERASSSVRGRSCAGFKTGTLRRRCRHKACGTTSATAINQDKVKFQYATSYLLCTSCRRARGKAERRTIDAVDWWWYLEEGVDGCAAASTCE